MMPKVVLLQRDLCDADLFIVTYDKTLTAVITDETLYVSLVKINENQSP